MIQRPWHITLTLYTRLLYVYSELDVCHTEYDMHLTCPDYDYGTPLNTYNDVRSDLACGALCSENMQCRSLQYDPNKEECWTNGEKMTTFSKSCSNRIRYGEIQLGSCNTHMMFKACSSDADCAIANSTCRSGSCKCKNGHPYDYRSDSCPASCTKYGNTFQKVTYYIPWKNNDTIHGTCISKKQCLQRCLTATSYVCRLVEYQSEIKRCALSELNALTARPKSTYPDDWTIWDRNCA